MSKKFKWSAAEDARLDRLRGAGVSWEAIAVHMPGRTRQACEQRYSIRHRKPRAKKATHPEPRQAPLAPVLVAIQQAEASALGRRRVSTATLLADAELRARIATQGLTAGLLGDPPSGRSALDAKRGGGHG